MNGAETFVAVVDISMSLEAACCHGSSESCVRPVAVAAVSHLCLLQVCMISLASAQLSFISRAARQKQKAQSLRSASLRKDSVWLPAFADVIDQ